MRLPRRAVHAAASSAPKGPFCDHCERNLAPFPAYIRCAHPLCNNLPICVDCFSVGAADRLPHRPNHPYRVIEKTAQPLFHPDWQASEEHRLLSAMSQHGPNHWKPVSEYVGKGMIKCQNHYESVYLQPTSSSVPFPVSLLYNEQQSAATPATHSSTLPQPAPPATTATTTTTTATTTATANATANPSTSAPSPAPPQTTNIESPSAPKRDDFDVEWDDSAELLVADLNLQSDDPQELEHTLNVLDHFNARLRRRYAVKDYLMEGDILCFSEDDSLCLRHEQNLSNRLYALSWLLDPARFKAFYNAVMTEFRRAKTTYKAGRRQKAKRKAKDLDANGKATRTKTAKRRRTNKGRSTPFSKRKRSSAKKRDECPPSPMADATMPNTPASAPMSPNSPASPSLLAHLQPVQPSPAFLRKAKQLRRMVSSESAPPSPRPVDDMEDASQLSPAERNLCAVLHIPPTFFLEMKSVTLLTVNAVQQMRRNDKQSSSDKIVVPPANFAHDLDQADQSGSTAKKDADEENKDSLVLPPLTLPQVVNNHVLSNSGEQVEQRGSSPAQNKYETPQRMDQELLDFLTHIPENNVECQSPAVKREPTEVEEPQGGEGHRFKEEVKMDVVKEEDAPQGWGNTGFKKEEVKVEALKPEEASLDDRYGREVVQHRDAYMTENQGPTLVETVPQYSVRATEVQLPKTFSSSGSFPLNTNVPWDSCEGPARKFLPSPTASGAVSGPSYKEQSPKGIAVASTEDVELGHESAEQPSVQVHPAAPPRERVYLRLSLRPPGNSSPNVLGVVNANRLHAGGANMMPTSNLVPHREATNPHALGRNYAVDAHGGSREGKGMSDGAPSRGRVYLRTSVHQPMEGMGVPLVGTPQVTDLNEPHTSSHLQLPRNMARFANVCLTQGQRERDGNNATQAECVYPQQGTRRYLVPNRNGRVFDAYTAPPAVGCSQDGQAANPDLNPQADADLGSRRNEPGSFGSISEQLRGRPSVNATAGRVYLQTQPLPPAPETPSVLVEPQSVRIGEHQARFQNKDDDLAPALLDQVNSLPPRFARTPAEEFEAVDGHQVVASGVESGYSGDDFGKVEMASPKVGGSSSKGEAVVGSAYIPDSSVGEAGKTPLNRSSSGEQYSQRMEGATENAGSEFEDFVLDEGKAESEDDDGSDSARESPCRSPVRAKFRPGSVDPDYEPSFGSCGEGGKVRKGVLRSTRRVQARGGGMRTRSGDQTPRRAQIVEDSEEIVSEGRDAESDSSIPAGEEDPGRGSIRTRRFRRTRRAPPSRSAVTPTRRSSRIQQRSRRLTDPSPDPRPLKKRQSASLNAAQAAEIGVTAYVNMGASTGSIGPVSTISTRNGVNRRGRRKLGGENQSGPRRSSGRVVKKTQKAKELEIITPQVDPQCATLSSDSNDSLRLMPAKE